MGRFQLGKLCVYDPNMMFRRGHENCRYLSYLPHLSVTERRQKIDIAKQLGIGISASFTDLDLLLNTRQYHRASQALTAIRKALSEIYSKWMELCENPNLVGPTRCSKISRPHDLTLLDGMN
jgi:hypothetical protein